MRYAELTNYFKLYSKCYWGNHLVNDHLEQENMITSRNWFAERYKLKYYIPEVAVYGASTYGFDHCEGYSTENGLTFITSPYMEGHQLDDEYGLIWTKRLYGYDAMTYIKEFKNMTEFRAWENSLDIIRENIMLRVNQ